MANEEKQIGSVGIDLSRSFDVTGITLSCNRFQGKNKNGGDYERVTTMLLVGSTPVQVVEFGDPGRVLVPHLGKPATYKLTPPRGKQIIELPGALVV